MNDIKPQKYVKIEESKIIHEFQLSINDELLKSKNIKELYINHLESIVSASKQAYDDCDNKEAVKQLEKIHSKINSHNQTLQMLLNDIYSINVNNNITNTSLNQKSQNTVNFEMGSTTDTIPEPCSPIYKFINWCNKKD